MSVVAYDFETTGLSPVDRAVSVSFTAGEKSVVFGISHPEQDMTEREAWDKVQRIINKTTVLVAHKAQFDYIFLLKNRITVPENVLLVDPKILWWLVSGHTDKNISLEDLARKLLRKGKVKGLDFSKKRADEYPLEQLLHYNKVDTELAYQCYVELINKVDPVLVRYYSDMIRMVAEMRFNGIHIDRDELITLTDDTKRKVDRLESELVDGLEYPINMKSRPQLSCAIYGGAFTIKKGGTETVKKRLKSGKIKKYTRKCDLDIKLNGLGISTTGVPLNKNGYFSTKTDVILKLKGKTKKARDWLEKYKVYNKWNTLYTKFLKSYVQYITDEDLIHPDIHLTNTATGRTSESSPNAQQLPRVQDGLPNIKNLFTSRFKGGYIVDVDLSGAEWRVAAYLSGCAMMIQRIKDGIDAHKHMASRVFGIPYNEVTKDLRQQAKSMNFGVIYGQGGWGFANRRDDITMIKTEAQGDAFVAAAYEEMPGLAMWHDKILAIATNTGKIVMDTGRVYNFSGEYYNERNIKNYPVQGLSFDITMTCLIVATKLIKEKYGDKALFVNHVHDCGVWDCADEETARGVHEIASKVFLDAHIHMKARFNKVDISIIPVESETEYGPSWGNMEEMKQAA